MDIYDRISKLCEENNLSGVEFGERLGLKKSPLTDWKNKKSKPTIDQVIKMCDIFAISSEYILFGKTNTELKQDERELLELYRQLPNREQIRELGRLEAKAEQFQDIEQEKLSSCRTG